MKWDALFRRPGKWSVMALSTSSRKKLKNKLSAIEKHWLTKLQELIRSSTEDEDNDDEHEEPATWNLHKFSLVFHAVKHLNDLISDYDPSVERSLKITRGITDVLKPYQEMFEQLKRQQRQLPFTMFFKKTLAADEPTQSTSRAEPEPTTSSTTRSPSPRPVSASPGSTASTDYLQILLEED
jgi:hypothetical protein